MAIYRGWLKLGSNGEEDDILFLGDKSDEPLAERIMEDIEECGRFLTVRYYTADAEFAEEDAPASFLRTLYGAGNAEYRMAYSEITGYLWTDEKLQVGGHDLLEELKSHVGRFCQLEVEYHKEPPADFGVSNRAGAE